MLQSHSEAVSVVMTTLRKCFDVLAIPRQNHKMEELYCRSHSSDCLGEFRVSILSNSRLRSYVQKNGKLC